MSCALHQGSDCLLVELLLCFMTEEALAGVDKGFPRWYSFKTLLQLGTALCSVWHFTQLGNVFMCEKRKHQTCSITDMLS